MRFVNSATNPDFFLTVFDIYFDPDNPIVDNRRLNRGDDNGIGVKLTPNGDHVCTARWTVRTDDGRTNEGTESEGEYEPGGRKISVSL
jgi:hypothetical protein